MNIKKTVRMVEHWRMLPREFVEFLVLEIVKAQLEMAQQPALDDSALSNRRGSIGTFLPQPLSDSLTDPFKSIRDESGNHCGVEIKIKDSVLFFNG